MSKSTEKGQALILIALAAIGLFAFSALAIDGTRIYSDKRHAQNAADTAVLAAALAKARGGNYVKAAQDRATGNGYTNDNLTSGPNTKVSVNLCSDTGVTCDGIVAGHESEYIRVQIISTIPTTFGRVLGRPTITTAVEAIARVQGSTSSSNGSSSSGDAMVATKGGNYDNCFFVNGGAELHIHNSGIYVNCSGNEAVFMNGGLQLHMDTAGQVVGCYGSNGGAIFDPIQCAVNGGVSQTFDASTFASVPTMPAQPSCSQPGKQVGGVLSPGYFDSGVNIQQDTVMGQGVYCFRNYLNVTGQNKLDGPNGKVTIVMENGDDFNVGDVDFTFQDLELYTTGKGSFIASSTGILNASRLRFYAADTGDFKINGRGGVNSNDAYIYLHGGEINWNGKSTVSLHAAPQGDPEGVGGLLVYMPWSNTTPITLNGGANIHLTGTCLMPHAHITLNGGVNFELHSQIIGYEYTVNGGGTIDIFYLASENYNPPNVGDSTIQLTQ